ncbi:MAG: LexA family transcriptional regulator [Oxalobacter sp.]|nr:LexA family transcriptional regulator [Oxalobacter sp.]
MGIGRKIREIRKSRKLNISDVELRAGISEGNLSRIETGKQWPREETLIAIANALDCSIVDFFSNTATGVASGQQIPLVTYAQTETLQNINKLHTIRQELSAYASSDPSRWIPAAADMPENAFALEIGDSSMLPDFHENDHVIIDPSQEPKPGDFILAKVNHETLFRKYRPRGSSASGDMVFQLMPLNEDYPSLRSDITSITIIGTMLEHRRYRKT